MTYGHPRPPTEERAEASTLHQQDAREELQRQLADIRGEVARCASALCADEPLPTSEVAEIRQQLSALSSEVRQTSHVLAPSVGAPGPNSVRELELSEVRRQLEALQGQVSRAMYAALSRPGVPLQQEPSPPDEPSELRAEVGHLRSELARVGSQPTGSHASTRPKAENSDLTSQIEALR